MNASSICVFSLEQLKSSLKDHLKNRFKPTVAIGFSSPDFPFQEAIEVFNTYNIDLVGCTSSGELLDDKILKDSFSAVLMDIDPSSFKTVLFEHQDDEAYSSGLKLYDIAVNTYTNPGIIMFISGVKVVGDGPVSGIRASLKKEMPIYGGLAGDNLRHDQTSTFSNGKHSSFGLAALILDTDKIQMTGLAVSGWKPLGKTHQITKAHKNIIYEIDDQPALDLFLNYFGNIQYRPSNIDGQVAIPGQYPLKIFNDEGASYLRSLLIYDTSKRSLLAAGEIKSGSNFKFCPPPDFSVVEDTIEEFQNFKNELFAPEALLMVSCKGRHTSFGPMLEEEIKSIYEIWDVPMVGFLSNGEIGNASANGICEFHNVSCSLVGLKEKL